MTKEERKKEKKRAYNKAWREKNKESIKERQKAWREVNRDKIAESQKAWGETNRERILQKKREYAKIHMAKRVAYAKAYNERKPEVKLASTKKSLTKFGKSFDLKWDEYAWALLAWGKTVKKKHGAKCGVCGSNEGLNTHHILFKTYFPELSLNENNGIPLCKVHHKEVHRLNPIYKVRAAA